MLLPSFCVPRWTWHSTLPIGILGDFGLCHLTDILLRNTHLGQPLLFYYRVWRSEGARYLSSTYLLLHTLYHASSCPPKNSDIDMLLLPLCRCENRGPRNLNCKNKPRSFQLLIFIVFLYLTCISHAKKHLEGVQSWKRWKTTVDWWTIHGSVFEACAFHYISIREHALLSERE